MPETPTTYTLTVNTAVFAIAARSVKVTPTFKTPAALAVAEFIAAAAGDSWLVYPVEMFPPASGIVNFDLLASADIEALYVVEIDGCADMPGIVMPRAAATLTPAMRKDRVPRWAAEPDDMAPADRFAADAVEGSADVLARRPRPDDTPNAAKHRPTPDWERAEREGLSTINGVPIDDLTGDPNAAYDRTLAATTPPPLRRTRRKT